MTKNWMKMNLKVNEGLDQHEKERESGSDECDVDIR